ncbi:adenylate/guanylate cyclase domain-containing protein [Spirochaetia bacterium]|nr:adenylate/guanylate cyclase domain-containing protein [Spirochaetia bacterium]
MKNKQIKIPIVLKLSLVITFALIFSLGVIIFLSHYFIYNSVNNTQAMNNRALNNKNASFVENFFNTVYTDTLYCARYFNNKDYNIDWRAMNNIAAIYVLKKAKHQERQEYKDLSYKYNNQTWEYDNHFINESFFVENNLEGGEYISFLYADRGEMFRETEGDMSLFDASKYFNELPVLLMRVTNAERIYFVFFLAEEVVGSFTSGTNSSILLNSFGDPLIISNTEDETNGKLDTAKNLYWQLQEKHINTGKNKYSKYKHQKPNGYFFAIQNIGGESAALVTLINEDVVFESINNTTLRNIYLSVGVLFIAIIIIWFFSLGISTPLTKMYDMSQLIEDGEYDINIKITNNDETGLLTQTMNNMSNALGNFERFTNRTIARLARKEILPLGGENKSATFFFSDIRSFTAISEKLRPTEVISFLNDYMEGMVACVIVSGGAIDKFIGDAVMAHWGAVESCGSVEGDAINGVTASLMMRASLASFNEGRGDTPDKPIIKIGCGLNSGTVVAGLIGTEQKIVYTVIGDAVGFADRCETFNKAFGTQIVISEYTYNLLRDNFIVAEMKTVTEYGRKVKTYAVINIKNDNLLKKVFDEYLPQIPKINMDIAKRCIGPGGPQNLDDLRTLLDIPSVDLSTVNVDEEEKKYAVSK